MRWASNFKASGAPQPVSAKLAVGVRVEDFPFQERQNSDLASLFAF